MSSQENHATEFLEVNKMLCHVWQFAMFLKKIIQVMCLRGQSVSQKFIMTCTLICTEIVNPTYVVWYIKCVVIKY